VSAKREKTSSAAAAMPIAVGTAVTYIHHAPHDKYHIVAVNVGLDGSRSYDVRRVMPKLKQRYRYHRGARVDRVDRNIWPHSIRLWTEADQRRLDARLEKARKERAAQAAQEREEKQRMAVLQDALMELGIGRRNIKHDYGRGWMALRVDDVFDRVLPAIQRGKIR